MTPLPSLLPAPGWHSFLDTWQLLPLWSLFAVLALAAYVGGLVLCRRGGRRAVHPVRVVSFVSGLVLLMLTVSSAIGVYAMALMWMHMIEHLLLIMVVPALLVLGHPLTVLRTAAQTRGREAQVDRFLRSAPVLVLTHPLVAFALYAAVIVGTHLTPFMDVMASHPWAVGAEQVLYVASGWLFLLTLVGDEPIRWRLPDVARIGLVLVGMTPDTVVGIVLMQATHVMFPAMAAMRPAWAPAPLDDLQIAGAMMWVAGDGLMMLLGVALTIVLISRPASTNLLGLRLEGVRRRTMAAQVARGDTGATETYDDTDVDDDEQMLAAYNRMLGRINEPPGRSDGS